MCMYIYICIYVERERETVPTLPRALGRRGHGLSPDPMIIIRILPSIILLTGFQTGQDKRFCLQKCRNIP